MESKLSSVLALPQSYILHHADNFSRRRITEENPSLTCRQDAGLTDSSSVQALCKTSGSTLGYGFPTMDLDEDDGIGLVNGDGTAELPLIEAVP